MKDEKYRLIMVIGLYIGIFVFVIAIIALLKNIEEIKTDPFIYGMNEHDFQACTCRDTQGRTTNVLLSDYVEGVDADDGSG